MKNLGIGIILALSILVTSCLNQSNNDAQRIVGTWTGHNNNTSPPNTITFTADGTYSWGGSSIKVNYFVNNGKILTNEYLIWDYYLSPDGTTLFLEIEGVRYWLNKQ